jgi:hypothetical protein
VIEESPECTALSHHSLHEEAIAVNRCSSIAGIGLDIDGILRGRGYETIGEGSFCGKVTSVPIITSFGSGRLPTHNSDGLAGCWGG